jgi:hypothetical protein
MDTVLISIGPLLAIVAVVVGRLRGRRPVASLRTRTYRARSVWRRNPGSMRSGVRRADRHRCPCLTRAGLPISSAIRASARTALGQTGACRPSS